MKTIITFIKKESVLFIATILAIISAFIVTPSAAYLNYIDWRTLGILLSLMAVMSGFKRNGLFKVLGEKVLSITRNVYQLSFALVFLCFFTSMLITNDVSLITFVPFAIMTLTSARREDLIMSIIILQTVAANLGSMLLPIGNPQNLYLYQQSGMNILSFIKLMLPYTLVSGVLILIATFIIVKLKNTSSLSTISKIATTNTSNSTAAQIAHVSKNNIIDTNTAKLGTSTTTKNIVYGLLFILCLLVVLHILPFYAVLIIVFITIFILDKTALKEVDYCLLLTFIALFIFTGNIGEITSFTNVLKANVEGNEIVIGVAASQLISNVPAALLLSDFTYNLDKLIIGVNLGGLGTLIASMASLISYKFYSNSLNNSKEKYVVAFSLVNIVFLAILYITTYIF